LPEQPTVRASGLLSADLKEESDADIRKLIDEMNNQPSTSTGQSCSSFSSFQYDPQNVSFVLPEHLRLILRCLLAQKAVFEFYKGNSYDLNQLNSFKKQTETQIMSMFFYLTQTIFHIVSIQSCKHLFCFAQTFKINFKMFVCQKGSI
jgi:hypothetical protein